MVTGFMYKKVFFRCVRFDFTVYQQHAWISHQYVWTTNGVFVSSWGRISYTRGFSLAVYLLILTRSIYVLELKAVCGWTHGETFHRRSGFLQWVFVDLTVYHVYVWITNRMRQNSWRNIPYAVVISLAVCSLISLWNINTLELAINRLALGGGVWLNSCGRPSYTRVCSLTVYLLVSMCTI